MSIAALLLADSRFPAGGHAYSGGVEPAVTAGTVSDLQTLETFLRGRLRTAGLVAAGLAAAACAAAQAVEYPGRRGAPAPGIPDGARSRPASERENGARVEPGAPVRDHRFWSEIDAEADARTPAPAQREASRRQGRALLRAARAAWPDAPGLRELAASAGSGGPGGTGRPGVAGTAAAGSRGDKASGTYSVSGPGIARGADPDGAAAPDGAAPREYRGGPHHAVVLGAAAAAAGCDPQEAARIAAYQAVAGPASAAVRLLALDPMRATGVLAGLADDIELAASQGAAYADGPLDELPGASAPALDLLAETHIRAEVRLFES